jgi:hypothetical protein
MEEMDHPVVKEFLRASSERQDKILDKLEVQMTSLHSSFIEATKGLTILNSAAVAAMLAMTQALVGKVPFTSFKNYAIVAIAAFLCGAISATSVFFFHAYGTLGRILREESARTAMSKIIIALFLGLAFFVTGAVTLIIGLINCF